jgi:hypothetical protein
MKIVDDIIVTGVNVVSIDNIQVFIEFGEIRSRPAAPVSLTCSVQVSLMPEKSSNSPSVALVLTSSFSRSSTDLIGTTE